MFSCFPYISLCKTCDPRSRAIFGPRSIIYIDRYIVGYTVGKIVLQRHISRAITHDFRTYIRRYTSLNENFDYGYPHSNALLTFFPSKRQWKCTMLHLRPVAVSCIYGLPAAYIRLSTNEMQCYVMTSSLRKYVAGYTVANL